MAVTPTGSPPWVRTTDFSHYGGDVNKQNYQSQGAVDPLTDVTAEQLSRLAADVAAIARVTPFCVLTFKGNDSVPAAPTVEVCNLMTGVRTTSYTGDNPPSGFPLVEYISDGQHRITFASTYADPYSANGSFAPRHVIVTGHGGASFDATAGISGQVINVHAMSGGAGVTDRRMTVEVY
jgi:hypothetical protein